MTDKSRAIAAHKIQAALDHIEEAQRRLDLAGQELCSVQGLAPEWTRGMNLCSQVRKHWDRVDAKLRRAAFDLDSRLRGILDLGRCVCTRRSEITPGCPAVHEVDEDRSHAAHQEARRAGYADADHQRESERERGRA